jgi:peptide/nickel transport system permease protein
VSTVTRPLEGKVGLVIVGIFLTVVIFGPTLAPFDPTQAGVSIPDAAPSGAHWLGTDNLGRDILSRILAGGRSVVVVPLVATLVAFMLGGFSGMLAAYRGGRLDRAVSGVVNVFLAVPPLLTVLVIITTAGGKPPVVVLSVGIVYAPYVARILRGATQGVVTREYVEAAQARGESTSWIVLREILPNIAPTAFVEFALRFTYIMIFVATLNFLGLGSQPPSPNWGLMVAESLDTVTVAPLATLAPALAVGLLAVGVSLIADAVTQRTRVPGAEEYVR